MDEWKRLHGIALPALDEVFVDPSEASTPDWTVGGGAAIGFEFGHRSTDDIDIFLQRGRLKQFLPSNNAAAKAISDKTQWPGHHLKFELDKGEIDFLTAPLHTEPGFSIKHILGRDVAFETPEEVIVKKMRYRAVLFTARDVFDLAVVHSRRPNLVHVLAHEVPDKLTAVRERVRLHASRGVSALEQQIAPTAFGRTILPTVFELADAAINGALAISGKDVVDRPRSIGKGPADLDDPGPPPVKDQGRGR